MTGIATYAQNAILAALFDDTPFSVSTCYVQLHTGDPGPNCVANVAINDERVVLDAAAPSGGTFTSVNDLVWEDVASAETYTHFSVWDALINGNPLWSGPLTEPIQVNIADSFTIYTNALTASIA